ncbi:MAG: DUF305 domain-containing protein [Actinobacteria bacterium]|nr:DUF305 domain-containing protein [Actinomycetota bacterium]
MSTVTDQHAVASRPAAANRSALAAGSMRRPTTRTVAAVAAGFAAVTALGACGGGGSPTAATSAVKTSLDPAAAAEQDAAFATAMFDHRHQALQLVGLVAQYGQSTDVVTFASTLQRSYDTQMRDLEGLLTEWGKPVPHVEGHSDLGDEIPGLLTAPELEKLRAASPADFEKQFLTVLAAHEKRATAMAQKELRLGADPQATAYAQDVLQQTTSHLAEVDGLLKARG